MPIYGLLKGDKEEMNNMKMLLLIPAVFILTMCIPPESRTGSDPIKNKARLDSLRQLKCPRLKGRKTHLIFYRTSRKFGFSYLLGGVKNEKKTGIFKINGFKRNWRTTNQRGRRRPRQVIGRQR